MFDDVDLVDEAKLVVVIADLLVGNHIDEAGKLPSRALRTGDCVFDDLLLLDSFGAITVESMTKMVKLPYGLVPGQCVRR